MGQLNLPTPHGYGIPTILSQWQAGQNRRQKKEEFNKQFKLKEDQFKLQEKEYSAKKEQLEITRKSASFDNFVKMFDTGIKHLKDPRTKKFGLTLTNQAVERYNAANPNNPIDISNFTTGEEITDELKKHSAENLEKTYKVAIEKGDGKSVGEFHLAKREYEKYWGKDTANLDVKVRKETNKTAISFMLPDNTPVLSYDGGRTYRAKDGSDKPMPFGSTKTTITHSGEEMANLREQKEAGKELDETPNVETPTVEKMNETAKSGTGVWSSLAGLADAIVGGLGMDKLFGGEGMFPDTMENRQTLRLLKQTGKKALMNSAKGSTYEGKILDELFPNPDKMWRNPASEAKKFKALRNKLLSEKRNNLKVLTTESDPKIKSKLKMANIEIDDTLSMIGGGEKTNKLSKEDNDLINKYLKDK